MNYKNNLRRVKNFAKKKIKLLANYPDLKGEISNLNKINNQLNKDNDELNQKYIKLDEDTKKRINGLVRKENYIDILVKSLLKENEILQNFGNSLSDFSTKSWNDLTIIIPYKESHDVRKINLRIVLDYLVHIGIKNIIISEEYDYEPTTGWVSDEYESKFSLLNVICTKSDGLFSRSILINRGVEEATTSFLCIQDGDVVLPKEIYEYSLNLLFSGFDLVYPFNRKVIQISDKQSFLRNYDFASVVTEPEFRPNADGGMQFIKKESFFKIGGYNTSFKGWGSEDNEFILRVILGNLKFIRLNNSLYHLKHDKSNFTKNNDDILFKSYTLFDSHDVNALINQNEYLMNTSLKYNKQYEVFSNITTFNYKVSIVIPLYNPTKFLLKRAIKSLMDQTLGFEALEIIIIDNGSTEYNSINLINSLTKKYGNIRCVTLDKKVDFEDIFNIGKNEPSADYVMFLNYKNYFISNACEILYNQMLNNDSDIIFGDNINLVKDNNVKSFTSFLSDKIDTKSVKLISCSNEIQLLDNDILIGTKLFKKSFLLENNFKLNSSVLNQINFLNSVLLFKANEICLVDVPVLVYDDFYKYLENVYLSDDLIIKNFNDDVEFFKQYYYLFKEFSPINMHIPLNHVSYWIDNDLMHAKLKQEKFKDVVNRISFLVDEFLKNDLTMKPKNNTCKYFYKYIAEKDYSHAYEIYEVLN